MAPHKVLAAYHLENTEEMSIHKVIHYSGMSKIFQIVERWEMQCAAQHQGLLAFFISPWKYLSEGLDVLLICLKHGHVCFCSVSTNKH